MTTPLIPAPDSSADEVVRDSQQTTCCIVGGGPGGVMLALLLARQRVPVTLLEQHKDFDRDFRGDTIHPSTLELLDQIGLAAPLHQLQHAKIYGPTLRLANTDFSPIDFRRLKTRFPYILLVPQARFLDFLAAEGAKYQDFRLVMGANVEHLIEENGQVHGVRYRAADGMHEVRAPLTVGADGRFSRVRHLAGFEAVKTSSPMDVLWFRLPHIPGDLPEAEGRVLGGIGVGRILGVFDRFDYWQVAFVFPKGQYQNLRADGIEAFRRAIVEIEPSLAEHVKTITDWHQCSLLSVESSRCPRWFKPGLLLIGDAAHVMSPVGGVGINYAIQDAVVTTNLLAGPLKAGRLQVGDLAGVQKEREWPTKVIQGVQSGVQNRILANVLRSQTALKIPWFARAFFAIPLLRDIPARLLAFGVKRVRLSEDHAGSSP
jgi:2-polyprenyl-6-methoxyphenol hydroxylase-like FAD-dependent oxidoreductase